MNWLRHVLSAGYLYAQESVPIGQYQSATLGWGSTLLACLLLAWLWRRVRARRARPTWLLTSTVWASAWGLGSLAIRPWVSGALTARVWFFAPTVFALFSLLLQALTPLMHGRAGRAAVSAMSLRPSSRPALCWSAWCALCAIHCAALGVVAIRLGLSLPAGSALSLGLFAVIAASVWRWPRIRSMLRVDLLSPLFVSYAGWLLIQWVSVGLGVDLFLYATYPYAEPWSPWLDAPLVLGVGVLWTLAAAIMHLRRSKAEGRPWDLDLVLVASILALVWYIVVIGRQLSHGATGSDPYCYLQMAADLARHATALHKFPLTRIAQAADVPTWPLVHVGYHPPRLDGMAATVWPIGWSLLLAPFHLLGGEMAAILLAPLCLFLAGVGVLLTSRQMRSTKERGWLAPMLAALLLLTSREAVLRTLVPMADAAAMLSTVLFMWCLYRLGMRQRLRDSAMAGLTLALAYWIRHPQLFLGVAFLAWMLLSGWERRARLRHLCVFAAALAVGALPDLLYHWRVFGAPWIAESPEWHLISLRCIPGTLQALWRDGLLRRSELGYLWVFVGCGLWRQLREWRDRRFALSSLAGFVAVLVFSLCYSALRWRDLLPLMPWLVLWAGWGVAALWGRVADGSPARRAAFIGLVLLCLCARLYGTVDLAWRADGWTFGHISETQRLELDRLSDDLPANAVVACGLNSGAVARYAGRETVRPDSWTHDEFASFYRELERAGYGFYVLDEGDVMAAWVEEQTVVDLERIGEYAVPTSGWGGGPLYRPAMLYRVTDRASSSPDIPW